MRGECGAAVSGRFIWTRGGRRISLLSPNFSAFTAEDIAGPLSRICRWTGHVRDHYSVAQHCVFVSYLTPPAFALEGAMHDVPEIVTGDVSSPVKSEMRDQCDTVLDAMTAALDRAVFESYGVTLRPMSREVRAADVAAAIWEARLLVDVPEPEIAEHFGEAMVTMADCLALALPATPAAMLAPLSCADAERAWLNRVSELGGI